MTSSRQGVASSRQIKGWHQDKSRGDIIKTNQGVASNKTNQGVASSRGGIIKGWHHQDKSRGGIKTNQGVISSRQIKG